MPIAPFDIYTQSELTPAFFPERMLKASLPVVGNLHMVKGTVVGICSNAAASCVQTLTQSSATGGTFTITFGFGAVYTTAPIPYNATAAQVAAALQALPNIGSAGVGCTGGALGTNPVVATFAGTLANQPQPTFAINNAGLVGSGAAVSVALTTPGVCNGGMEPYSSAMVANPTVAPTLSAAGTDGTYVAGDYEVTYTYVTAGGESLPSPAATVTLSATNHIGIASLTTLPAAVLSVNVYVNQAQAKNQSVTSNATGAFTVTGPQAGDAVLPPEVSTAYVNSDGSQVPVGILVVEVATDTQGNVNYGPLPGTNGFGAIRHVAPIAIAGYFNCADLTGLDANAVKALGRLIEGTTSVGVLCVTGA